MFNWFENDRFHAGRAARDVVIVLVFLFALTWLIQGNNFFLYKMFAPAQEGVRRDVFENTKSYRQGMIQELENMQFEYNTKATTQEQKDALASIILRRAAGFDLEQPDVSTQLYQFIMQLKRERNTP